MQKATFQLALGKEERVIRGDVRTGNAKDKTPVILLCHGFKGFKDWGFFPYLAEQLANAGFAAISFNFSMNGIGEDPESFTELDKFGKLTFSREQEDLAFLLDKIKKQDLPFSERFDLERIGIFGHSRGGGNSILFALEHEEIKSVVVWNSIHRFDFFAPELIETIKRDGVGYILNARTGQKMPIEREVIEDLEMHRERFDLMGRLPNLTQPLLIVQGDQDLPGFYDGAQEMAKRAPKAKLHVIHKGTHTFGAVHPFQGTTPQLLEAVQATADFFKQTL